MKIDAIEKEFDKEKLSGIIGPLIVWYEKYARSLPWRENADPYPVWVSEIMLQQTRISAALPYFKAFMDRLPTVSDLASIDDDELLKLWQGLGYYSRARHLKEAAQKVMMDFDGVFPVTFDKLLSLPGIGRYTAGAVASICGNQPVSAVDGNVLRVLCRYLNLEIDVLDVSCKKAAENVLNEIISKDKPGVFNEAIMELGETVCLPNVEPNCPICPLCETCLGYKTGEAKNLPLRKKKAKRKQEKRIVFLLMTDSKVALLRRPDKGLLANLWELPNVLSEISSADVADVLHEMGVESLSIQPLGEAKHIFSHIEWHMVGYKVRVKKETAGFTWVTREELLREYPVPSALEFYLKKF